MKEHPLRKKLQEIDEVIKRLRDLKEFLDDKLYDEEIEACKKLKAKYSYSAVVGKSDDLPSCHCVPKGLETLRILRRLTNKDIFVKHLQYYGICSNFVASKDEEASPYYFRIDDHLYHVGGGHLILKDFVKVSDEEWQLLKEGEVPERLLRR